MKTKILVYTKGVSSEGGGGRRVFMELLQHFNKLGIPSVSWSILPMRPAELYNGRYRFTTYYFTEKHSLELSFHNHAFNKALANFFLKSLQAFQPSHILFDTEYSYREFTEWSEGLITIRDLPPIAVLVHDQLWKWNIGNLSLLTYNPTSQEKEKESLYPQLIDYSTKVKAATAEFLQKSHGDIRLNADQFLEVLREIKGQWYIPAVSNEEISRCANIKKNLNKVRYIFSLTERSADESAVAYGKTREDCIQASGAFNPIEMEPVSDKCFRTQCQTDDKKVLLAFSRATREKNIELILAAFALVKKEYPLTQLWIAGLVTSSDEDYISELKTLSLALGLENDVCFLGTVSDVDMNNIYQETDALICAQVADFNLSIYKALYYLKPVITLAGYDFPSQLRQSNAVLWQNHTIQDLADSVIKAFIYCPSFTPQEQSFIKNFTFENYARKIISAFGDTVHSLKSLRNRYTGKRAFIIGNGPSLKKLDLTKLKDEITFGVNSIFYLFDEMGFKPTFYVVEDKLVAEDRAEEINNLNGMIKIFGRYLEYCLADREDVIWANVQFDYSDYPDFPHFSKDADKELWVGGTVTYLCMQLAYYMGFDQVYLIGFDHSYAIPSDALVEGTVITSGSDDPNHFHPSYFGKGKRWHDPRLDRMELAYNRAREVYESSGKVIANATAGGKLEIFERIRYDSLFPITAEHHDNTISTSEASPKISVVVCTHRNPLLLEKTLESLANQSLDATLYEVIVIDNDSRDETKSVVGYYPAFRYILETELGLSHARNAGLRAAKGDIIAFIDDDAEADSKWIESLLNVYQTEPDVWAAGGKALPIWDAEKPSWLTEDYYRSLSLIDWGGSSRPLHWPERIIGVNCSFRKEVFQHIGCFDTSLGRIGSALLGNEDTEIQQRIHQTGRHVYYTAEAIVYHHVPAARMTREYFDNRSKGTDISQAILTLRSQGKHDEIDAFTVSLKSALKASEILDRSRVKLAKFQNIHKGRRCVIIGNGPSLNKMDLSFLKDEITFGMNRIYLLSDKWNFTPTYYVSVNPLVLEQSAEDIIKIPSPKFLSHAGIPYFKDTDDLIFFDSKSEWYFSKDACEGISEGWTVTYVAMQLAYYMGFSEVILIGVDHHFVTQGVPNKEVVSQGADPNHFHPGYFGKGTRWHLPDLERSEGSYRKAQEAFATDGRRILDATVGGKLTIFPKVDYQQVFFNHRSLPNVLPERTHMDTHFGYSYLISAIVSTYNSEKFIHRCLQDLVGQTLYRQGKLEIIVINSGSQQNEEAIVLDFAKQHPHIVYRKTCRETIYGAWNRGIELARGKYITNANTDDIHREDALEQLAAALEANPHAELAYSYCILTSDENDTFHQHHGYHTSQYPPYDPSLGMLFCYLGPHPLWRRTLFDRIGLFDASYSAAGDYEFQMRFIADGGKAVLVPEVLSLFYQNPDGVSLQTNKSEQERLTLEKKYREEIPISRLFAVNLNDINAVADAWTAQGIRALTYQIPWHSHMLFDLPYAVFCFGKALSISPKHSAALHNLVTALGIAGQWSQCEKLTELLPPAHELSAAVIERHVPPFRQVDMPSAVSSIIHTVSRKQEPFTTGRHKPDRLITIGIDARTLFYPESVARGIGQYAFHHLRHAALLKPDWRFLLFGEAEELSPAVATLVELANVSYRHYRDYRPEDLDLVHIPDPMNLIHGFDSPMLMFRDNKLTATFHDLIPLVFDVENWPSNLRDAYMRRLAQLREYGCLLLANSDYTRRDLCARINYPPELIHVIKAGLNRMEALCQRDQGDICTVKEKFGITKPFFLHVGDLNPNKNFQAVVESFVHCAQQSESQLVVVGRMDSFIQAYANEVNKSGIGNIVFTGYLPRTELEALYRDAVALLFLSKYEGFGFPVLEAMALGCPVIASNTTSIPEVAGNAALLFEPSDVSGISKAMEHLIRFPQQRHEMRKKGFARAAAFSWDKTAELTIAAWEAVLKPGLRNQSHGNISIIWEGPQFIYHSMAHVNRELCLQLIQSGHELSLTLIDDSGEARSVPRFSPLAERVSAPLAGQADIHVRHWYPPDFSAPPSGHLVMIQPWEFGSVPKKWIEEMNQNVDEVWVPSSYVRDCYIRSGLEPDRIAVVPNGIDTDLFSPETAPTPLSTTKRFRFLYVGSTTLERKGFDILINSYVREFSNADDVCLVIKDMAIYTGGNNPLIQKIAALQEQSGTPEIIFLTDDLTPDRLAGLYTACTCLVQPYRGEGFCLPIAEAMAAGLPVIVTGHGACLDFCNESNAYLIPATEVQLPRKQVYDMDTVDYPWWAEPDLQATCSLMRFVYEHPEEAKMKGHIAQECIAQGFTWQHAREAAEERFKVITTRSILRFQARHTTPEPEDSDLPSAYLPKRSFSLLFIAPILPTFDRDSGSFRLYQVLKLLREEGHRITFLAQAGAGNFDHGPYKNALEVLGIDVIAFDPERLEERTGIRINAPQVDLEELLSTRRFDACYIYFYFTAAYYLKWLRDYSPKTKIIIDSVDFHYLREHRAAELSQDNEALLRAEQTLRNELFIYEQADLVIMVTDEDRRALLGHSSKISAEVIPNIHPSGDEPPSFSARTGIIFVGNFFHTPNADAVLYLVNEIMPLVRKRLPEVMLTIVGNSPPPQIQAVADQFTRVTGYVKSLKPLLDSHRISVAPLRFGAGMKGKVGEAMSAGLPVVASPIAAEGCSFKNGEDILVAQDENEFADMIVTLYTNEAIWSQLSRNGHRSVKDKYSPESLRTSIRAILSNAIDDPAKHLTTSSEPIDKLPPCSSDSDTELLPQRSTP